MIYIFKIVPILALLVSDRYRETKLNYPLPVPITVVLELEVSQKSAKIAQLMLVRH